MQPSDGGFGRGDHSARPDQVDGGVDLGREVTVRARPVDELADVISDRTGGGGRLEWRA